MQRVSIVAAIGISPLFLCCVFSAWAQVRPVTPPTAARSISLFCIASGDRTTIYFSDIFDVISTNFAFPGPAFSQFLAGKYSYKGVAACSGGASPEQVKMVLEQEIEGFRRRNSNVVQTGWTFDPSAPSAAPSGSNSSTRPAPSNPQPSARTASAAAPAPIANPPAGQVAPTQQQNQPQTAAASAKSPDTSITGVYNGTYTCARVQLKLKLVLIAAPDTSLTGFFIIEWPGGIPGYPPPDWGPGLHTSSTEDTLGGCTRTTSGPRPGDSGSARLFDDNGARSILFRFRYDFRVHG